MPCFSLAQSSAWYSDVWKQLVAVLLGAGLAYAVSVIQQSRQRGRENKAAGNRAMAILCRQYSDFLIFRAGLDQELSNRRAWPEWLQLSSTMFAFSERLIFDLPSIIFLSENGGAELLNRLLLAETRYQELGRFIEMNSKTAEDRDEKLSEAGLADADLTQLRRFGRAVSLAKQAKLVSFNRAMKKRAADDFEVYQKAGQELRAILVRLFKDNGVLDFKPIGVREDAEGLVWRHGMDAGPG